MGEHRHVRADFVPDHFQFSTPDGKAYEIGSTGPYEYLLGALSGCLFKTFDSLAQKMKVGWEHVSFEVEGEKRDEKVATLKDVTIAVSVTGALDREKFTKAFETATRYCSIYQTLSHVAEMHWTIDFA